MRLRKGLEPDEEIEFDGEEELPSVAFILGEIWLRIVR
jgi:hypothetical protein